MLSLARASKIPGPMVALTFDERNCTDNSDKAAAIGLVGVGLDRARTSSQILLVEANRRAKEGARGFCKRNA